MKTIRQLASVFGLSRTTLLYYDRLGLLRPDFRTSSGLRYYSAEDEQRLAQICRLREAGMPLKDIDAVLEPNQSFRAPLGEALSQRLTELNREIGRLRKQQQVVVSLLRRPGAIRESRIMNQQRWVKLLTTIGLSRRDRRHWHHAFERLAPEAHQDFLESIGVDAEEIAKIRDWSRQPLTKRHAAGRAVPIRARKKGAQSQKKASAAGPKRLS